MSESSRSKTKKPAALPKTDQEPDPPPTGRKNFWSSDKFLSLLAFLISLGTFITFAYQTYLIQQQQYASVMPYLMLRTEEARQNDRISSMQLKLVNNGVGPAFIRNTKIVYQDSVYEQDPAAFYNTFAHSDSLDYSTLTVDIGYVIPAGKEVSLVDTRSEYSATLLDSLSRRAVLEVTYASIYDEVWQITSNASAPQKIK